MDIKMQRNEMEQIHWSQVIDQWRAVVDMEVNLWMTYKGRKFLEVLVEYIDLK